MKGKFVGRGYDTAKQNGKYRIEYDEDDNDEYIYFHHPRGNCIVMVIRKTNKIATFEILNYHPDCTSPEKMEKGSGTREMVEYAFSLLREKGCKQVELTDESTIECGKQEVKLGKMFFLKYGMTWYEKHFGFRPSGKYAELFEKAREERVYKLDTKSLAKMPCEMFTKDFTENELKKLGLDKKFECISWVKKL